MGAAAAEGCGLLAGGTQLTLFKPVDSRNFIGQCTERSHLDIPLMGDLGHLGVVSA